jgi:8-oxo-dGTP pyrophosphatase MutT (NUDIX family)
VTDLDVNTEETIHEGPRFTVKKGTFGDDEREREWIESPAAVAILAYDEEQMYLVRQAREPIRRGDILELPAGLIDVEGESPLDTAKRELEEEIGMQADEWVQATSYFSSSGMTDEITHVFFASGLTKVSDVEEGIELVTWPLNDIDGLIDGNADAKTLVGLLWLRRAQLLGGTAATWPPGFGQPG